MTSTYRASDTTSTRHLTGASGRIIPVLIIACAATVMTAQEPAKPHRLSDQLVTSTNVLQLQGGDPVLTVSPDYKTITLQKGLDAAAQICADDHGRCAPATAVREFLAGYTADAFTAEEKAAKRESLISEQLLNTGWSVAQLEACLLSDECIAMRRQAVQSRDAVNRARQAFVERVSKRLGCTPDAIDWQNDRCKTPTNQSPTAPVPPKPPQ